MTMSNNGSAQGSSPHQDLDAEKSNPKTDSTASAAVEKLKKKQAHNLNNHPDVDPDASTQPLHDDE